MPTSLFTETHDALRASVARFVADRIAPHVGAWDEAGGDPGGLHAEWAATGLAAVHLPEAIGGGGGDVLDAVVVAEELGRCGSRAVALSLLDAAHGAVAVLAACADPVARELAARALSAQVRVALAVDAAVVVEGSSEPRLTGTAYGVVGVGAADHALVRASGPAGPALFLVGNGGPEGWRTVPAGSPSGLRALGSADVVLDAAPAAPVVADVEDVLAAAEGPRHIAVAAAAVASAWATWEAARTYALEREAFGRPIGRFQVNRHHLAHAATRLTAARQIVHDAAWGLLAGRGERPHRDRWPAPAAAARYADRTCAEVADICLQLHGGYGYSMELPVQRAWRDDIAAALGVRLEATAAHVGTDPERSRT